MLNGNRGGRWNYYETTERMIQERNRLERWILYVLQFTTKFPICDIK